MALIVREFGELERENDVEQTCFPLNKCRRRDKEDEVEHAFFGLHTDRTANIYTKWKINEGEFEVSDEKQLEAIRKSIKENSPELEQFDFKFNANRHRYLERHWRKFIGSLINPTYDNVTKYNFHDTLECLIRRML